MLHAVPFLALFAQLAAAPTVHRAPSRIPLDTTLAAPTSSSVALALESGGVVRVVGGETKVVRVKVTDRGRHCADCVVGVYHTMNGIEVRTARTRANDTPADLQVQLDVPTQTNLTITSAGGAVDIEGVDGTVSGTTEFGALTLFRLSGPLLLETKRGDVTLRQSWRLSGIHVYTVRRESRSHNACGGLIGMMNAVHATRCWGSAEVHPSGSR